MMIWGGNDIFAVYHLGNCLNKRSIDTPSICAKRSFDQVEVKVEIFTLCRCGGIRKERWGYERAMRMHLASKSSSDNLALFLRKIFVPWR